MSTSPAPYAIPGLIALALTGAALPALAEEAGFVEGASANLNLRNFYINRNFTNPTKAQGKAEEWTQSFILDAKSGFTQGTVGFGMDVLGLYSVKLDGGKGTGGGTLANDSYNASYDNAQERSWQVRHDYNFAALGIPGLTLMNRYISGDNVHSGTTTDGKEWGRESELGYTVQSGTLRNLNVRWRNSTLRRDFSNNEFDENRLIISYPISLL